jgi:protein-S-isoprenylcysteine O-methyltransferase Ste14
VKLFKQENVLSMKNLLTAVAIAVTTYLLLGVFGIGASPVTDFFRSAGLSDGVADTVSRIVGVLLFALALTNLAMQHRSQARG